MSPTTRIYSWENLAWHARQFRYLDFLIRSIPFICLVFILYVVFHDTI